MRKLLILLLSLIGLFDAIYLWWVYTSPSHPLICLGTGCDVARASAYSHLWGLPLPFFGAVMYGALALLAVAESLGGQALNPLIRYATLAVSAAGFIASLGLSGVEAFVLHAWCAWCVASAITVTLIFLLSIYGVAKPSPPPTGASALTMVRGQFVLFIVALIVGSGAFFHLASKSEIAPPEAVSAATLQHHLVQPDSHATGNLQSPVTVVEFGDFECPICGLAQKTVEKMLAQYGTKIRFVFRQFPVASLHPWAEKAAEASECAAGQGKFWEAEKLLYERQSDLSAKGLEQAARDLGLNMSQFDACLSSGETAPRVAQDIADGKALGVEGTPTFFVGDRRIVGPPNYAELSAMINDGLGRAGMPAVAETSGPSPGPGSAAANSNAQKAPLSPPSPASAASSSDGLGASNPFGGALAGLEGTSALACNPNEAKLAQPSLIRTPETKALFEGNEKPVFVDVREPDAFAADHIPGAVNIPVEDITSKWNTLPKDRVLVFYEAGDRGGSPSDVCAFSRAAARVVLAHGYAKSHVLVYQDGLKGWQEAGLPVSK
ncbi:MAG: thioredoxin domain-containing protein [Acidobacteriota bacterium]|nr:thioredoxin domain-containing protein [Acidobacteriota bacterium]